MIFNILQQTLLSFFTNKSADVIDYGYRSISLIINIKTTRERRSRDMNTSESDKAWLRRITNMPMKAKEETTTDNRAALKSTEKAPLSGTGLKDIAGMARLKEMVTEGFINVLRNKECAKTYGIKPPSRRIYEMIYVDMPDAEARKSLFDLALSHLPTDSDIDTSALASLTNGYNCSDICYITQAAARKIFNKSIGSGDGQLANITQSLLEEVISTKSPSVSSKDLKEHERVRQEFSQSDRSCQRTTIGFK